MLGRGLEAVDYEARGEAITLAIIKAITLKRNNMFMLQECPLISLL